MLDRTHADTIIALHREGSHELPPFRGAIVSYLTGSTKTGDLMRHVGIVRDIITERTGDVVFTSYVVVSAQGEHTVNSGRVRIMDKQELTHGGENWSVETDGLVIILTVRCDAPTVALRYVLDGSFTQSSIMEDGECLESVSWSDASYSLFRALDSALDMLGSWEDSEYDGDDYSHDYGDDGDYYAYENDSDLWNEY